MRNSLFLERVSPGTPRRDLSIGFGSLTDLTSASIEV
jgi:hypothetical protein